LPVEVFSTMTAFSVLAMLIFGMGFVCVRSGMIAGRFVGGDPVYRRVGVNSFGAGGSRHAARAAVGAGGSRDHWQMAALLHVGDDACPGGDVFIFDLNMFHPITCWPSCWAFWGMGVGTIFAALTAAARDDAARLLLPVMAPVFVADIG
jgi:hypothetical protein